MRKKEEKRLPYIGVWRCGEESEEDRKREKRKDYRKKKEEEYQEKNQFRKKEKIPETDIANVCDMTLFLSVEQYFDDIAFESDNLLILNKKVNFVKDDFVEKIQKESDLKVEKLMSLISEEFKNSKVNIEYKNRSILVTDGIEEHIFMSQYVKQKLNIVCKTRLIPVGIAVKRLKK